MNNRRPAVPADVERQLRYESGFGCARCGFPFCEYHHIIEYSVEAHFRVEDMMALCPNCHHEANIGAITVEEQREYKKKPYNIIRGYSEGQLSITQKIAVIDLGSITFINDNFIIVIDEEEIVKLNIDENGKVDLDITLYDKKGNILLIIEKNTWIMGDISIWDFEFKHRFVKLRTKNRQVDLVIDARSIPMKINATFWKNDWRVKVDNKGIHIGMAGKTKKFTTASLSDLTLIGMVIKLYTNAENGENFALCPDERFENGMISTIKDKENNIKNGIETWQVLKSKYNKLKGHF